MKVAINGREGLSPTLDQQWVTIVCFKQSSYPPRGTVHATLDQQLGLLV